jgi:4-amino-4-deoxy-L-arabinose transferase-like glycosyltransferase
MVAVVVAVAFVVRLVSALTMHVDPRATFLHDPSLYDWLARQLAAGNGYIGYLGAPMLLFPPGYPAALGLAYGIFGTSLQVAWTLNAVLGALTCLLLYAIGSRLFERDVGLTAAAMLAVFPGDVFFSAVTLTEATFTLLFVAVLFLFVRWTPTTARWHWVTFGIVLGFASLVRGVALPFLVVPAVVWTLNEGVRATLRRCLLVVAGLALVVLPWTARNYRVSGAPILLSTDGPCAFFFAHNPIAEGTDSHTMDDLRRQEFPSLELLPRPTRDVEQAKVDLRYGARYLLTHPRHELTLIPRRLYYLFAHDHHVWSMHRDAVVIGGAPVGPVLDRIVRGVSDLYFFGVLALALVGLPSVLRAAHPAALVLPLTVAYFLLLHGVIFFGGVRYHAPLIPVFSLLAAVGLQRVRERLGSREVG